MCRKALSRAVSLLLAVVLLVGVLPALPAEAETSGQVGVYRSSAQLRDYVSIVELTIIDAQSTSFEGYGALYDIDGNGAKELYMIHPVFGEEYGCTAQAYSLYTVSNGKAIPLIDTEILFPEIGASGGHVAVIHSDGKYKFAITSSNGDGINSYGSWKIYTLQGSSLTLNTTVEFTRCTSYDSGKIDYDSSYATFNGIKCSYREYEEWEDALVEIMGVYPYGYKDTMSLEELLEYLKENPVEISPTDKAVEEFELSSTTLYANDKIDIVIKLADFYSSAMWAFVEFYCEETEEYLFTVINGYDSNGSLPYADGKLRGNIDNKFGVAPGTYVLNNLRLYADDEDGNDYCFYRNPEGHVDAFPLQDDLKSVKLTVASNREGWSHYNDSWYFYKNGAKVTGWLLDSGKWYYFDSYGVMQTGWVKISGVWYYMEPSGAMATGWQLINGQYYYFYSSGVMKTGWLNSGGKRYFFRPDGAMATGWVQSGGKWYFMNESGAMQSGWLKRGNAWYYLNASGVMQTGWVKVGSSWYYMNGSGVMQTGWLKLSGKWYYLNSSGAMVTGTVKINGVTYKFSSSGVWLG